jgi:rare lipoprotein A (peptidoglycan hydrolase)
MRVAPIVVVTALLATPATPVLAQDFNERWSIIPKAHAEPPPKTDDQNGLDQQTQPQPLREEANRPAHRAARSFSGKASFYSYSRGKTASGTPFNRNLPTAAHRSLPFGTKVRVTNLANHKWVVVVINDRGPQVHNRVIDLSLAAARTLGITDRGVADIRGEVL